MIYSDALRYRAVRHYKDARHQSFDEAQDIEVDSFLDHLKKVDPDAFRNLENEVAWGHPRGTWRK